MQISNRGPVLITVYCWLFSLLENLPIFYIKEEFQSNIYLSQNISHIDSIIYIFPSIPLPFAIMASTRENLIIHHPHIYIFDCDCDCEKYFIQSLNLYSCWLISVVITWSHLHISKIPFLIPLYVSLFIYSLSIVAQHSLVFVLLSSLSYFLYPIIFPAM